MPTLRLDDVGDVRVEQDRALEERSEERFDRQAFAMQALDRVCPARLTVAVCEGRRLVLETGKVWGSRGSRWAMLAVPPDASRRAIALAVASLVRETRPYAMDLLFAET